MDHLESRYTLKEGSIKKPEMYLGADVKKCVVADPDNPDKVQ